MDTNTDQRDQFYSNYCDDYNPIEYYEYYQSPFCTTPEICIQYWNESNNECQEQQCQCQVPEFVQKIEVDPEFHLKVKKPGCERKEEEELCKESTCFFKKNTCSSRIPIVEDQISRKTCKFLCKNIPDPLWNSKLCLERILVILQTPILMKMEEEMNDLWNLYLKKSPNGIFIEDLKEILQIILILSQNLEQYPFYQTFEDVIFQHAKSGLRIKKFSDKNITDEKTLDDFRMLNKLLVSNVANNTRAKLIDLLLAWLDVYSDVESCNFNDRKKKKNEEIFPCSKAIGDITENLTSTAAVDDERLERDKFVVLLEKSHICWILIELVQKLKFTNLTSEIIFLLTQLAKLSDKIRNLTMKTRTLDSVLANLENFEDPIQNSKLLGRSIELVFAFFANTKHSASHQNNQEDVPPSSNSFQALLTCFYELSVKNMSKQRANLRNDVALAIYILIHNFPQLKDGHYSFAQYIGNLLYKNILEGRKSPTMDCSAAAFKETTEDLEFMKIMMLILEEFFSNKSENNIILEFSLVQLYMRIILGPCTFLEGVKRDNCNYKSLVQICWRSLTEMAHIKASAFLNKEGVNSILALLNLYGIHGGIDIQTLSLIINILRIICSQSGKNEEILPYLTDCKCDAMIILLKVLQQFNDKDFPIEYEPLLCNLLLCFAYIGEYSEEQKEIFLKNGGVKILCKHMDTLVLKSATNRQLNPFLQICIAECILHCIAYFATALELFLSYEGMFRTLDLLELRASHAAELHLISCIIELCEYPKAIDQLLNWRRHLKGKNFRLAHGSHSLKGELIEPESKEAELAELKSKVNQIKEEEEEGDCIGETLNYENEKDRSLAALLCDIWRDEESRMSVPRDSDHCISCVDKPLMSQFARNYKRKNLVNHPKPSEWLGAAALDMLGSVRPKIYLLTKIMTEATNSEAVLFGGLSLRNQITMQITINFLDLKRGEIWLEMIEGLRNEHFNFVISDEKALDNFAIISRNKVNAVIDTQKFLLSRNKEHAEMNERELYSDMHKSHLQDHLLAVKEVEYIALTSNYQFLKEKRLWKKSQLKNAEETLEQNDCLNVPPCTNLCKCIASAEIFVDNIIKDPVKENKCLTSAEIFVDSVIKGQVKTKCMTSAEIFVDSLIKGQVKTNKCMSSAEIFVDNIIKEQVKENKNKVANKKSSQPSQEDIMEPEGLLEQNETKEKTEEDSEKDEVEFDLESLVPASDYFDSFQSASAEEGEWSSDITLH